MGQSSRYRIQAEDTSAVAEQRQLAAWRRMTAAEKAAQLTALAQATQELAAVGVRQRHPDATDREIFLRLAALRLNRATMVAVYDWDPAVKGP